MSPRVQPVFSVEHLTDPFPLGSVTISGGVFGYGEVTVAAVATHHVVHEVMGCGHQTMPVRELLRSCWACAHTRAMHALAVMPWMPCADFGAVPVE